MDDRGGVDVTRWLLRPHSCVMVGVSDRGRWMGVFDRYSTYSTRRFVFTVEGLE